jgi:hypothetical protein
MRESVAASQQLNNTIEQDIVERIRIHQNRITRLKGARMSLANAGAAPTAPLVMLAHGDSWFDYPLYGNGVSLSDTDVIAQLRGLGNINPVILNLSHHGDATTDELSWPKQQRMIDALQDPANWMESGRPDAILFSGGGNDIAGDHFCIFLNYATPGATGLNSERFTSALGIVQASYQDLFAFRDRYAPGVPLIGHCYDFPIPNGAHPACVGPWLKPSLDYCGWNVEQGTDILKQALTKFKETLDELQQQLANNFVLAATQALLKPQDWANELHPFPGGFKTIAAKFVEVLRNKFPGRI